ncbi:MAG: hypothetical protein M1837_006809 [Sclerophora amabilis]|nr:MAG: hypothetical protein M1837_006809 [Sclerophora amabilis]
MKRVVSLLLLLGASASLLSSNRRVNGQQLLAQGATRDSNPTTTACAASLPEPKGFNSSLLLSLHRDLVSVPSITGSENKVGTVLDHSLQRLGFTVERQYLSPDRFNVYAYYGRGRATRTVVTSHIDTVPPSYPYEAHCDGRISGRGSVDAKGSVAAQIAALTSLHVDGVVAEGAVGLLYVVGEETSGDGMRAANALGLSPETVIFGEPTDLALACGHKGVLSFRVLAEGKAAHSGYPWLGVNANSILVNALVRLQGMKLPSSEKYGDTTVNLGRIEGGVAGNVVAAKAMAEVTIRLASGEPQEVKKLVEQVVLAKDLAGQEKGEDAGTLEVEWMGDGYGPVDIDCDVEGFNTSTVNYGTDIPNLSMSPSQKRCLYGPGSILVAHSDHEHLFVSDLYDAVKGYRRLMENSLSQGKD